MMDFLMLGLQALPHEVAIYLPVGLDTLVPRILKPHYKVNKYFLVVKALVLLPSYKIKGNGAICLGYQKKSNHLKDLYQLCDILLSKWLCHVCKHKFLLSIAMC